MISNVFLGFGSNLGNREEHIYKALDLLGKCGDVQIIGVSTLFDNPACTPDEQPSFLNAVAKIKTSLNPSELLRLVQNIETLGGRTLKGQLAARTIDIDILFYDKEIVSEEQLSIPHPLLHERDFVLKPMLELAPHFVHPVLEEPISVLYKNIMGEG